MVSNADQLSVRSQCEILNLTRSNLYYCPAEAFQDTKIMNEILEIHRDFPYYGYRKIKVILEGQGFKINRKKVQRLMKIMGIRAIYPGPKTSVPNPDNTVFPYLLKGLEIDQPNKVWGTDITYLKLPVGMVYLFALLDWHSRFIVGYKLVNTMEAIHGKEVFEEAFSNYGAPQICNSDQGSQFTGDLWVGVLEENDVQISHNGVGRCIDNVRVERFWRSLKYEDFFLKSYESLPELKAGIDAYISHYNHKRPHQALGYKAPASFYFNTLSR